MTDIPDRDAPRTVFEKFSPRRTGTQTFVWWMSVDGVVIGYAKTGPSERDGSPGLWDVEIRDGHRDRGHAGVFLRHIAEAYGVERLRFSGNFTPEGHAKLARVALCDHPAQIAFRSMTFVRD